MRKRQFSQMLTLMLIIFAMSIVVLTLGVNAVLLFMDKQPMSDVAITVTQVFGGVLSAVSNIAYNALAGFRDNSKNKHGVTAIEMEQSSESLPVE